MMMEVRIDSGIEVATMTVDRHERRKSRIMSPVRQPAMTPSRTTPLTAARTNTRWSDDERVGAAQRESDDPHRSAALHPYEGHAGDPTACPRSFRKNRTAHAGPEK